MESDGAGAREIERFLETRMRTCKNSIENLESHLSKRKKKIPHRNTPSTAPESSGFRRRNLSPTASSFKPYLPPIWYLPDKLPNSKDSGFMSSNTVSASNNSSPSYCQDDDVGCIMSDMDSFGSSLI